MKKTAKKVLSLLLCAILCISILPAAAFAENDAGKEQNIAAAEAPDDSDTPPSGEEESSPAEDTAKVPAAPEQETPVEALTAEEGTEEDTPSIVASGTCGENVTWALYDSGTLVISGTGAMEDYCDYSTDVPTWTDVPWKDYKSEITEVIIEDGVTSVGADAFRDCGNLISLALPDSVTRIGEWAFSYCGSLTEIQLPSALHSIGMGAFNGCSSLTSIMLPAAITSIGTGVFQECTKLAEILTDEGNTAYASVDGILFNKDKTELICYPAAKAGDAYVVPDSVSRIADDAFSGSGLASILLPENMDSIGTGAFSECTALKAIVIPDGITVLEAGLFSNCRSLSSVTIPEGVTTMVNATFMGCWSLSSIELPESLTHIGGFAFFNCESLTEITIPANVTSIENGAFSNCYSLTAITFKSDAPAMAEDCFGSVYATACYYENNETWTEAALQDYGGSITWKGVSDDGILYSGTCGENLTWTLDIEGTLTISGTGKMEDYSSDQCAAWFDYLARVKSLVINEGVTGVGAEAFRECRNLKSVSIPDSVTSIGDSAFYYCGSLTSIALPAATVSIGACAFQACTKLAEIMVDAENTAYASEDGVLFNGNKTELICYPAGRAGEEYSVPDSVLRVGEYAFSSSALQTILLPVTLNSIGNGAFSDCGGLTTMVIPKGVTVIEAGTFAACSSLTAVTIPAGVTRIDGAAFMGCSSLTSIVLPKSVTAIGTFVFSGCGKLTEITFKGDAPSIGDRCFTGVTATAYYPAGNGTWTGAVMQDYGGSITWTEAPENSEYGKLLYSGSCGENVTWALYDSGTLEISGTGAMEDYCDYSTDVPTWTDVPWKDYKSEITEVIIEDGVTSVGADAFRDCGNLISLALPDSVTRIGEWAFSYCGSLTEIQLPSALHSIGMGAFNGCSSLTSIMLPAAITSIGTGVFQECTKLAEILTDEGNTAYASVDGILFNKDKTELICYPAAKAGDAYVVPDSVSRIADDAFSGSGLASILLPENMDSIGTGAFSECTALKAIVIPDGITVLEAGLFSNCGNLSSVTIPEGVTTLVNATFMGCLSLSGIELPESLTSIGGFTFFNCESLGEITIPAGVTAIYNYAFSDCGNLTEITFKGNAPAMTEDCFTGVTATAYYPAGNGTWTETVMQDYGGSITWTAKVMNGTLTGTAVSWDGNGNEVICLYSGLSEEEIQADITAGAAGASYIAQCGTPGQNADGERYNVDFCFEKADVGEYTLAVYKPGGYVLKTLSVTVNGDAELGEIALQLRGDISGDGSVNTMDLIRLMKYINGEPVDIAPGSRDVNGDGRENIMDLIRLMKYINGENG